jgi:EAL and modified HD-GYP domain-containing signal transduction protein
MLKTLVDWFRGGPSGTANSAPSAQPVTAGSASPLPSAGEGKVFGRRRPLLAAGGTVAGVELRLPPTLERRSLARSHDAGAVARGAALLAAARPLADGGRAVLLALPVAAFSQGDLALAARPGLWIASEGAAVSRAVAAPWRERGARIGVCDLAPQQVTVEVDFAMLRASDGGIDTVLLGVQRWRQARPQLPLLVTELESIDDVERMLNSGVHLTGGRLDRSAAPLPPRALQPAAHRICVLLNELAQDRDTATIAESVRSDVNLTYRLLRYVNSPALGLSRRLDAVDQAVAVLGRNELYRWLSVLLLGAGQGRPAAKALQESALTRARLLELLALGRQQDGGPAASSASPATLFTAGLMSTLDLMLQVPLAAAIQPLRLPDDVRLALLERQGPLAAYLKLLEVLDGDDEQALDAVAEPFGGSVAVVETAQKAWAWAEQAGRGG